jgi:hypothetical protein
MGIFPPKKQKLLLLELATALDSRSSALRRDECGDYRINGKRGYIYSSPEGFQLCYFARNGVTEWDGSGPHIEDYLSAKRQLIFCRLIQDGTGEGIFILDRLPVPDEAAIIREVLHIPRRKQLSEETLVELRERGKLLAASRTGKNQNFIVSEANDRRDGTGR